MNQDRIRRLIKILGIVVIILALVYLYLHRSKEQKTFVLPAPMVVAEKPKLQEMVEYLTQTGTTVAYNSVDLVARVEGYLQKIEFTDGSFVKKGKNLFVIEPEPYLEKLKAAQAQVAAEKASYEYAQSEYQRQKRMYRENATSLNNVEKWSAKMLEIKAEIDKAVADEQIAAINYSYTHVAAPFNGRVGRHLVDIGNLVGNGAATNLATIEQISPIYIYFNLNELDLIRLRQSAQEQGLKPAQFSQIPAYITMQNSNVEYKVALDFVNTSLNASTGTMEFRAIFENEKFTFLPGQFVQVHIAVSKPAQQLTVPNTAVLYDQIGPYVLLVDDNNTVILKHVTLGGTQQGRIAVTQGLNAQDRVIVSGLQNATPGNKVQVQGQTALQNSGKKAV